MAVPSVGCRRSGVERVCFVSIMPYAIFSRTDISVQRNLGRKEPNAGARRPYRLRFWTFAEVFVIWSTYARVDQLRSTFSSSSAIMKLKSYRLSWFGASVNPLQSISLHATVSDATLFNCLRGNSFMSSAHLIWGPRGLTIPPRASKRPYA